MFVYICICACTYVWVHACVYVDMRVCKCALQSSCAYTYALETTHVPGAQKSMLGVFCKYFPGYFFEKKTLIETGESQFTQISCPVNPIDLPISASSVLGLWVSHAPGLFFFILYFY